MSEGRQTSSSQLRRYLRVSQRCGRWSQKFFSLKPPGKVLKHEKKGLTNALSEARALAASCARPDQQELHRQAIDDIIRYADQLRALEPGCECKARERKAIYDSQVDKCVDSFPIPDVRLRDDMELSPTPSAETRLSQGGNSPSSSESASEKSTSPSVSPPPGGQAIAGAHRDRDGQQAGTASASRATDATISADGTRAAGTKRKAEGNSLIHTIRVGKKRLRRLDSNQTSATATSGDDQRESDAEPESEAEADYEYEANAHADESEATPRLADPQDIEFSAVYQDGSAETKHRIESYLGEFYIFRCDKCKMNFNKTPLRGASTHLQTHSLRSKYSVTVLACGIKVLNRDLDKQRANNDAFDAALEGAYTPNNNPQGARKRAHPKQQAGGGTKRGRRKQRATAGLVLDPVPGEIYLVHWTEFGQDGVVVLPRGDAFGDPTFSSVGLPGSSLAEDTDLLNDVPDCYRTCPEGRLAGWQDGYGDGGARAHERMYPVMRLDGTQGFRKECVDWIRVTDLREYDLEVLNGTGGLISNAPHIRQFERQRCRARDATRQQAEGTTVQDRRSATTEPDLSDYIPPSPDARPMDVSRPLADMAHNTTPTTPPDPEGPRLDALDEHGHGDAAVSDPAQTGTLTNPPLHNPFLTSAAIRPNAQNIIGHAATMGDGVPSRQHSTLDLGARIPGDGLAGVASEGFHGAASMAFDYRPGVFDSLGSENAALMSHSIPQVAHAGLVFGTGVPAGESNTPSFYSPRPTAVVDHPAPRTGAPPWNNTDRQGSASGQAGPATRVPPPIDTKIPTSGPPPHPPHLPQNRGTADSPIELDYSEEPPTNTDQPPTRPWYGVAKRTPNGFSPYRRSFDHKAAISQGSTSGTQPQPSAAQAGGLASGRRESPWTATGPRQVPTVPEAVMGPILDGMDVDFDPYIHEPHGM